MQQRQIFSTQFSSVAQEGCYTLKGRQYLQCFTALVKELLAEFSRHKKSWLNMFEYIFDLLIVVSLNNFLQDE